MLLLSVAERRAAAKAEFAAQLCKDMKTGFCFSSAYINAVNHCVMKTWAQWCCDVQRLSMCLKVP